MMSALICVCNGQLKCLISMMKADDAMFFDKTY